MWLTYFRMILVPFVIGLLFIPSPWAGWLSAICFIIASVTDWLDGYWARKYQSESSMGQLMDPIADKVLVSSTLIMLLYLQRIDPILVILLLARDTFIGGLRSMAASQQIIIAARPLGKWKTGIQMSAIPCLLIYQPVLFLPVAQIGYYGLWFSTALSLFSAIEYAWGYYRHQKLADKL